MGLFFLRIGLLILLGAAAVWLYTRWVGAAADKQKLDDQKDSDDPSHINEKKDDKDSDFRD